MEFLDLAWVKWLIGVVAGVFSLWVIPNKIWATIVSFFGTKLAPVMDKTAKAMDGAGAIAEGLGMEKLADYLFEGSDVVDEAEDIPRLLAEFTADGDLTAEEIKKLFAAGKEVGVEFNDVVLLIKKKPETK